MLLLHYRPATYQRKMPPLVIFLLVLVTLTRSSYSTSISYSGSGEKECTIEPNECRPSHQRLLRNITELGLSLNVSHTYSSASYSASLMIELKR